jgi:hypothetical protein
MSAVKDTAPDRNTQRKDEKLQECYYRHELPKSGCVFQVKMFGRDSRAARSLSILYIEM